MRRNAQRWRYRGSALGVLLGLLWGVGHAQAPGKAPGIEVLQALEEALTRVAEQVIPAVVQVRVERELPEPARPEQRPPRIRILPQPPRLPEDLPDFFRRFFEQQPPTEPPEEQAVQASGMVFRPEGYILTNAHVVQGAKKIEVKFVRQRRVREARLVGLDPRLDIAVLKVETNGEALPAVRFGDSDKVRIGQLVLAIGSPFEFEATVTLGIISAQERSIEDPGGRQFRYRHLLQTDAPINPGNSGGPLVNIYGEVIGVNNAIYSPQRGNIGIGFAIPINRVKEKLDLLIQQGAIPRGYLGVAVAEEDEEVLEELYGVREGALVREVQPNTPAEKAGLAVGDLIVEFNGRPIRSPDDLVDAVSDTPPQQEVLLKFLRRRETKEVRVELAPLPPELGGTQTLPAPRVERKDRLGLTVVPLPDEVKQMEGAPQEGVWVQEVRPDTPAAEAGLTPGAVIVRLWHRQGDFPIRTLQDYEKALQALGNAKALSLEVLAFVKDRWVRRSYTLRLPQEGPQP